jgi:small subunit ribosomal protein S4
MGRYTEAKCKLCRRLGEKLFLKGARCQTAKCPVEKRNRPPGMHRWPRGRPTPYGTRFREKQKCKRYYGVGEAQFRRIFAVASKQAGNTGANLLALLERRLDNVLKITGFAWSRAQARQLIRHRNIEVNGRKVDLPSYLVEEGDVIRPAPQDKILELVRHNREEQGHPTPSWIEINDADLTLRIARLPVRDDVSIVINDGLIVEVCSR